MLLAMSDRAWESFWNGFWYAFAPLLLIIVTHVMNRLKLNAVADNVQKIEKETNHMKDALVEATRVAGELKGGVDERARADALCAPVPPDMLVVDPKGKTIATIITPAEETIVPRTPPAMIPLVRKPGSFTGESGIVPKKGE